MQDHIKVTGDLNITLLDEFNNIKDHRIVKNLVVSIGKQFIASLLSATPETAMDYMAVGTGTTAPSLSDTILQTEIGTRVSSPGTWVSGTQTTTFNATFGPGNATGSLTEAGIFNASAINSGVMLSHTTFAAVNKAAGDTINVSWTITVN